jgi:hypothetical protein
MTTTQINDAMNDAANRAPWWLPAIGTYGLPAVIMMLVYFQVYVPDQDQRRELERANSQTLTQMGQTMHMLVDQTRRTESASADTARAQTEMLRIQSDQTRTMQEQTRILQEIMIDQKRGAWNDKPKPGNHAVIKGSQTNNETPNPQQP